MIYIRGRDIAIDLYLPFTPSDVLGLSALLQGQKHSISPFSLVTRNRYFFFFVARFYMTRIIGELVEKYVKIKKTKTPVVTLVELVVNKSIDFCFRSATDIALASKQN